MDNDTGTGHPGSLRALKQPVQEALACLGVSTVIRTAPLLPRLSVLSPTGSWAGGLPGLLLGHPWASFCYDLPLPHRCLSFLSVPKASGILRSLDWAAQRKTPETHQLGRKSALHPPPLCLVIQPVPLLPAFAQSKSKPGPDNNSAFSGPGQRAHHGASPLLRLERLCTEPRLAY